LDCLSDYCQEKKGFAGDISTLLGVQINTGFEIYFSSGQKIQTEIKTNGLMKGRFLRFSLNPHREECGGFSSICDIQQD
jgi:hypothetical protein